MKASLEKVFHLAKNLDPVQHSYRIAKVIIRPKAVLILLLLSAGCKPSPMPESTVPSTVSKDRGSPGSSSSA